VNSEKKLVVLVDDNIALLNSGKRLLEKKYDVATVPSAKSLFSLLDKSKPALILLDVDMPEMSGFQAIEILKAKPETSEIPVIFLTGRTGEKDRSKGLALGAIDYVDKPYEASALLEKIEMTLADYPL